VNKKRNSDTEKKKKKKGERESYGVALKALDWLLLPKLAHKNKFVRGAACKRIVVSPVNVKRRC